MMVKEETVLRFLFQERKVYTGVCAVFLWYLYYSTKKSYCQPFGEKYYYIFYN